MNAAQINDRLGEIIEQINESGLSEGQKAQQRQRMDGELKEMVAKEAVDALSDYANQSFATPEDFAARFFREHRTIQQSMIGLFLAVLREMAKPGFAHDLRNEAAVELARRLDDDGETRALPYL